MAIRYSTFDRFEFAKNLENSGFSVEEAEVISESFSKSLKIIHEDILDKSDLEKIRQQICTEIENVSFELRVLESEISGKHRDIIRICEFGARNSNYIKLLIWISLGAQAAIVSTIIALDYLNNLAR